MIRPAPGIRGARGGALASAAINQSPTKKKKDKIEREYDKLEKSR